MRMLNPEWKLLLLGTSSQGREGSIGGISSRGVDIGCLDIWQGSEYIFGLGMEESV